MARRYVGMTWTSFAALTRLSVPTVTVLKNLTNMFVICGAHLPCLPSRNPTLTLDRAQLEPSHGYISA